MRGERHIKISDRGRAQALELDHVGLHPDSDTPCLSFLTYNMEVIIPSSQVFVRMK